MFRTGIDMIPGGGYDISSSYQRLAVQSRRSRALAQLGINQAIEN